MMLFLISSVYVCLRFFPLYIFDWVSDVLVLSANYQLFTDVDFALSSNDTSADLRDLGISRRSFLNSIPWDFASFLLLISTILSVPKIGGLRNLINIRCIMKDPQTEIADVEVEIGTVVTRHDASLIESSTESSVQVIFQWGSYMGLIYLIDKVM